MERRKFTREFKLEGVRLISDRGVSYAQVSQDLGVHVSQLRDWAKKFAENPQHSFPGHGQLKPGELEITRLKREVIKLKAERDILKKPRWSLDFVMDTLMHGRRFRISPWSMTSLGSALGLVADTSLTPPRVVRELDCIIEGRGCPRMVISDNGTEFTSNAILAWQEHVEPG